MDWCCGDGAGGAGCGACGGDVIVVDWYAFRLLPCLSPLYENHSAVNAVDSALDTLASAVGKHQVVLKYFGGGGCPHGNDSNEK